MMAKPAISPMHREPNGRPQRASLKALEAADKARRLKETAMVRNQPHRRWSKEPGDYRLERPLGYFVQANRLSDELYLAGDQYTNLMRCWRLAVGVACPFGRDASPSGEEEKSDPAKLRARIDAANRVMEQASASGQKEVRRMCGYREPHGNTPPKATIKALVALAEHFGYRSGAIHPFAR